MNLNEANKLLTSASACGDMEEIKRALRLGADIDAFSGTPLIHACSYGHFDAVRFLLDNGADATVRQSASLFVASDKNYPNIARLLLAAGSDLSADDYHVVMYAAEKGLVDILTVLAEFGADFSVNNNRAIESAAREGHLEALAFLIAHGANPSANYNYPLYVAVKYNRIEIVRELLSEASNVVDPNQTPVVDTPLQMAAFNKNVEMALLLISYGASPLSLNKSEVGTLYDSPTIRGMWTSRVDNAYDYMLQLTNEMYPFSNDSEKIDILLEVQQLVQMPYVQKKMEEQGIDENFTIGMKI